MELTDLSFEGWVKYVFDHPVAEKGEPAWYFEMDSDWWSESKNPAITVEYMTRAFENIAEVAAPYTDAQLNQGLWFIAHNACSNHMVALFHDPVLWPERQRCIQSLYSLYEKLFLPRCNPRLCHRDFGPDAPPRKPLNSACFMWWDLLPFSGKPDDPAYREIDEEVLKVMEKTLTLDSIAVQEGALHGLGHWSRNYYRRVGEIIDAFLEQHPAIPDALKIYAQNARWENIQ